MRIQQSISTSDLDVAYGNEIEYWCAETRALSSQVVVRCQYEFGISITMTQVDELMRMRHYRFNSETLRWTKDEDTRN
jgi:hypothetical protein